MVLVLPKKCDVCGNAIQQNKPCPYCAQDLLKQARADEELALALERLSKRGRVFGLTFSTDPTGPGVSGGVQSAGVED